MISQFNYGAFKCYLSLHICMLRLKIYFIANWAAGTTITSGDHDMLILSYIQLIEIIGVRESAISDQITK